MKKSTYVLISLLLSLNFWNFSLITNILNQDILLMLSFVWILCAFVIYNGYPRNTELFSFKYSSFTYLIITAVFISMFSAHYFWNQDVKQSILTVRQTYLFFLLPALLFVQPSIKDIVHALKWITIGTVCAWTLSAIAPQLFTAIISEGAIERRQTSESADIGYNVGGLHFVVLYFYYKVQEYIKQFDFNTFLQAILVLAFIFLYQNRSMLFGAIIVLAFSLIKFQSRYKAILIFVLTAIIAAGILYTLDIWVTMFDQTQAELGNEDYNRWKSLYYFINEHSPNSFCYFFGNGYSSEHSPYGMYMETLWDFGIDASDIGLIGMWATYGILPLLGIYYVVIRILSNRRFPLFLKFICFHILVVPTIFHFWFTPGISFFIIIFYMYSYYITNTDELQKDKSLTFNKGYVEFSLEKNG